MIPSPRTSLVPHLGAFESTKIHGSGTDVLETTRHIERWREDLDLLCDSGIHELRYPVPWHRIETVPGHFVFDWIDGPLEYMRRRNMRPVVDLLHHTSFPDWLEDGFANPEFPRLYARFVKAFAERYPWIDRITVFNEPLATVLLCSSIGAWYPHRQSDQDFVQMCLNVGQAICISDGVLRQLNPNYTSVYIDTCEQHKSLDFRASAWVDFVNHRRFCVLDLVTGAMDKNHPLYSFFVTYGLNESDVEWFQAHAAVPDILGLDYYPHSEMDWSWNTKTAQVEIQQPSSTPWGFARVAMQYVNRYKLPVMLAETNVRGTVSDRITWLRFMEEQTMDLVKAGVDVRGFCWYPSIDSTDWSNLVTRCTGCVDPQGIWYLDEQDGRWNRFASELSDWYAKLAQGTATHLDLPAYIFLSPLNVSLRGHLTLMSHWDHWQAVTLEEIAA